MTNKLLTLEDIEKIETSINQQNYSDDDVFNLAATARAYWETKKKEVHINCRQCGMSTFVDIEDTNNNKLDDKPHAPTIRAMIEILINMNDDNPEYPSVLAQSLESILKEL